MPRFILRFKGTGTVQDVDRQRVLSQPNVKVVDSSTRMMLVEGHEGQIRTLVDQMPGWVLLPEQTVPLPDTRPKILHPVHKNHKE
jgi:hypothetical protein